MSTAVLGCDSELQILRCRCDAVLQVLTLCFPAALTLPGSPYDPRHADDSGRERSNYRGPIGAAADHDVHYRRDYIEHGD
jgi:hypothetical protein